MRKLFFLLITLIVISCNKDKTYKYKIIRSLTVQDGELKGNNTEEETKKIKALNDTIAYFDAVEYYIMSKLVDHQLSKQYNSNINSSYFELLDNKGNNISYINFPEKEKREREILNNFNLKDSILYYNILQSLRDKK